VSTDDEAVWQLNERGDISRVRKEGKCQEQAGKEGWFFHDSSMMVPSAASVTRVSNVSACWCATMTAASTFDHRFALEPPSA
jgi:hypothetical protein